MRRSFDASHGYSSSCSVRLAGLSVSVLVTGGKRRRGIHIAGLPDKRRLLLTFGPRKQQGLPWRTWFSPRNWYVPVSRRGHGSAYIAAQFRPHGRDLLVAGRYAPGPGIVCCRARLHQRAGCLSLPCGQLRERSARAHRIPAPLSGPLHRLHRSPLRTPQVSAIGFGPCW